MLMETMLGRFGSRLMLNPKPQWHQFAFSPLGKFYDEPCEVGIGVEESTKARYLPFCSKRPCFTAPQQEQTMTSLLYKAQEQNYRFSAEFSAPFYPGDEKLSLAPYFHMIFTIENLTNQPRSFAILLEQLPFFAASASPSRRRNFVGRKGHGEIHLAEKIGKDIPKQAIAYPDSIAYDEIFLVEEVGSVSILDCTVRVSLSLPPGRSAKVNAYYACFIGSDVLFGKTPNRKFHYTSFFSSAEDVITYAIDERQQIAAKTAFFEEVFAKATLPEPLAKMLPFAFQSFLTNTWWTLDAEGTDWFSAWEGYCKFHSTIDVEYNDAFFYLLLWPDLLGKLLTQWSQYKVTEGDTAYLCHDMGIWLATAQQAYHHPMQVEENTNYLLLLTHYAARTGDCALFHEQHLLIEQLVRYLLAADTNGNGFPDRGTANTVDDASAEIQFSVDQTYLGVKTGCALTAILPHLLHSELKKEVEQRIQLIGQSLDKLAWKGDHFAICLETEAAQVFDAWKNRQLDSGKLAHASGYSLYANNGLLYPLMSGLHLTFSMEHFAKDLQAACDHLETPAGTSHSSGEQIVWISQNIWRDFIALYLGLEDPGYWDRYWEYQTAQNRSTDLAEYGGFCDSPQNRWLSYYPRGITCLGYFDAVLRAVYGSDAVVYSPTLASGRFPLLQFADWANMKVPFLALNPGKAPQLEGSLPAAKTAQRAARILLAGSSAPTDLNALSASV